MDFVNFPQNLVYRQRERLDEFDIRNKNSLNYILESELFKLYRTLPGYKNYALSIFNTAYYVCMMALADYDPMRNFGDYLQRINEITQGNKDQTALVLSMVLMIIDAHKWKGAKVGIDNLALQIFYEIEKNDFIRYSFYEQAKTHFESRVSRTTLSPTSEFKPRTIYYKLFLFSFFDGDFGFFSRFFGSSLGGLDFGLPRSKAHHIVDRERKRDSLAHGVKPCLLVKGMQNGILDLGIH